MAKKTRLEITTDSESLIKNKTLLNQIKRVDHHNINTDIVDSMVSIKEGAIDVEANISYKSDFVLDNSPERLVANKEVFSYQTGYFNSTDNLFYEDIAFTLPIVGSTKYFYVDSVSKKNYIYNGVTFSEVSKGFSGDYNDLDNLPNLTTKIENIDVQNASGVTQFTTDGNDLKLDLNDFIVNNLTKVISKYAPTGTSNNIYYISNSLSSGATPRVNDHLRPYSSINAIVSPPLFAVIIYLPGSYSSENFNFNRLGDLVILYPNVSITVSNTTTGVLFSRIIGLDKNSSVINFNSKAPNFQISLIKGITGNNMPSVDGNTGNITLNKREDCIFNVTGTSASTVVGEFERCTINLPSTQIHSLSGSFKFCSVNNIFRIVSGYFENCFIDKINHTYLDQFVSFKHEFINCRIKNYKITALGSSIINPMTIPKLSYYNTDIINDDGLPIINGVADPQGIVVSRLTTKNILSNVPILGANSVATLRIGIPETVDTNFTQF